MKTKFLSKIYLKYSRAGWTLEEHDSEEFLPVRLANNVLGIKNNLLEAGFREGHPEGMVFFKITLRIAQTNTKSFTIAIDYSFPNDAPKEYRDIGLDIHRQLLEILKEGENTLEVKRHK